MDFHTVWLGVYLRVTVRPSIKNGITYFPTKCDLLPRKLWFRLSQVTLFGIPENPGVLLFTGCDVDELPYETGNFVKQGGDVEITPEIIVSQKKNFVRRYKKVIRALKKRAKEVEICFGCVYSVYEL